MAFAFVLRRYKELNMIVRFVLLDNGGHNTRPSNWQKFERQERTSYRIKWRLAVGPIKELKGRVQIKDSPTGIRFVLVFFVYLVCSTNFY